jgi:hypothetical protein
VARTGFFYDRHDDRKTWLIVGSRTGLGRFQNLLRAYADDPRNESISEHEHYGPYRYLKVMTWPTPNIDEDAIKGPLWALRHLANCVGEATASATVGQKLSLTACFSPGSPYGLDIVLREDEFDPASLDGSLLP